MSKMLVLYYSQSGNTEKMAKAVAEGAKNAGNVEVELSYHVEAEELAMFDAILMGAPTYHHDMPIDMKKLFEEAAVKGINLKGQGRRSLRLLRMERRSAEISSRNYEKQV